MACHARPCGQAAEGGELTSLTSRGRRRPRPPPPPARKRKATHNILVHILSAVVTGALVRLFYRG